MRRAVTVLFISLGLSALIGCHPQFQGTLANRDGDGTGPKPITGQAQVTSFNPASVVAEAADFTLTVNGLNFLPTTTVLWDSGTSLPTTYVSSTVLRAQVPASRIARPGTVTIIPSPEGSFNFGATFTITVPPLKGNNAFSVTNVSVTANDIAWDQADQRFYLSVASGNGINANTITALDPQTRVLGPSVSTGSEPGRLSVSTDGSYIYAGLNSAGSVRRYSLPALQPDITIPIGSGTFGTLYAFDVQGQPGSSHTVAIAKGIPLGSTSAVTIQIFDDAVARPLSVSSTVFVSSINSLLWNPNGQTLYGMTAGGPSAVSVMSVNPTGVQLKTGTNTAASYIGNGLHFDSTTGYLYGDTGAVIEPSTGAVVRSFSFNATQGGLNGNPIIMVPDGKLNIAYFLGQTQYNSAQGSFVIEAFDLTNFTFLGAVPISGVVGTPYKMIRWGTNGLAFLTKNLTGSGVYLISGNFVTSPTP